MVFYLLTILLHSIDDKNKLYVAILWTFVLYSSLEKFLQIFAGGFFFFFNDPWNSVDVLMIIFLYIYLHADGHHSEEDNTKLLGFTNMVSWIRGLTYLRSFESTRIFIFLVVEMIKQL